MRPAQQLFDAADAGHFLDVGARRERLGAAGQHDRADAGVFGHVGKRFDETLADFEVQRVARLGPVDADQADVGRRAFDEDDGFGHDGFLY